MVEVINNGQKDMQTWIDAFEGKEVDWDTLFTKYVVCPTCMTTIVLLSSFMVRQFHRYSSGVDNPVSQFYDVLAKKYPDAKVILTVRT